MGGRGVPLTLVEVGIDTARDWPVRLSRFGRTLAWSYGGRGVIHFLKDAFQVLGYQSEVGSDGDSITFDSFDESSGILQVPNRLRIQISGVEAYQYEGSKFLVNTESNRQMVPFQSTQSSVKEWVAKLR
jgi:hypothetical protein